MKSVSAKFIKGLIVGLGAAILLIMLLFFTRAASSTFSLEVAGDYYDVIPQKDGKTLLTVGGVSGKGAGAALIMANLQAALCALCGVGLTSGDVLLIYADGICEALNPAEEEFREHRIKGMLRTHAAKRVAEIMNRLTQEVAHFRAAANCSCLNSWLLRIKKAWTIGLFSL